MTNVIIHSISLNWYCNIGNTVYWNILINCKYIGTCCCNWIEYSRKYTFCIIKIYTKSYCFSPGVFIKWKNCITVFIKCTSAYSNIIYLCADFLRYPFTLTYDVIYSSLTMMHFEDKQGVIAKVDSLLKVGGVFCLSIDKNQSKYIDMGDRRIEVYPDTVDDIVSSLSKTNMKLSAVREIENAFLITCNK